MQINWSDFLSSFLSRFACIYSKIACDCDAFFLNGNCADETGKCACEIGYQGPHCATCSVGWSGYPDCKRCSVEGTISNGNSSSGSACSCKPNFDGRYCDKCKWPRANYPNCNGEGTMWIRETPWIQFENALLFKISEIVSSKTQSKAINCDDSTDPFTCFIRTLELFNAAALTW